MRRRDLQGFGGKSGDAGAHTPVEAPDSLHSIARARILDIISEGPIRGFRRGPSAALQDTYLNRTPVQNNDGSLNFTDVQLDSRVGLQVQDYIPGFDSVENEIGDSVALLYGAPYSITITHNYISAVRVLLAVAALSKIDDKTGDINAYSVAYKIEVSTDGGSYVKVLDGAFSGKTTTKYERSHRIDLPAATTGWTIRISRLTPTAGSSAISDLTYVESHTEVIDGKFVYPNSALVGSAFSAQQFSNIPTRAFDVYGRIVSVPSNYDPIARVYTGVWDGTFQPLWTNNPAWIYFDMATNDRFGLGNIISATSIDKWELYKIAQYCDQMVPTGILKRADVTTGIVSLSVVAGTSGVLITANNVAFITAATAHGFAVDDLIVFTGLTGGLGLIEGQSYWIIYVDGLYFSVSQTQGGRAIGSFSEITAGTASLAGNAYVRATGSFLTDGFAPNDEVNIIGFANAANNAVGVVGAVNATHMVIANHALTVEADGTPRTITTQHPTEPRFTCNTQLQVAQDAYKVLQDLASVFRGISYWAGGSIVAVCDMPQDPLYTYTNANVVEGVFNYAGTSKTARHTVALVSWSDDTDFGASKIEYVFDEPGVTRYGIIPTNVIAFGCTSQGQAQRVGRHLLLTERLCTNTVSFSVGLDGTFVLPGKVIRVADRARAGRRTGGRIAAYAPMPPVYRYTIDGYRRVTPDGFDRILTGSEDEGPADASSVYIDSHPVVPIAVGNTFYATLPDGTVESRTVTGVVERKITVDPPFSAIPQDQAVWAVETGDLFTQLFRVLSVTEGEGLTIAITALQYVPDIYDAVDLGTLIQPRPISAIPSRVVLPPDTVTVTSFDRLAQNRAQSVLVAEWDMVSNNAGYTVQLKKGDADWLPAVKVNVTTFEWAGVAEADYKVRVAAVGIAGAVSGWRESAIYPLIDATTDVRVLAIVAGVADIDARYERSTLLLDANATLNPINIPSSQTFNLLVTGDGSAVLTLPSQFIPLSGTPYGSTAAGVIDSLTFTTNDYGVSIYYTLVKGSAFTSSITPSPATGSATGSGTVVPSASPVASTSGGTGAVTHAWTRADTTGGTDFSITGGTTLTPAISRSTTTSESLTQTWRYTGTDSVGAVTTCLVSIELESVISAGGSIDANNVNVTRVTTPGHPIYASGVSTRTATFGTGPYTDVWTKLTGDSLLYSGGTSSAATFRTSSSSTSISQSATYRVTTTDSLAAVMTKDITVNLAVENGA